MFNTKIFYFLLILISITGCSDTIYELDGAFRTNSGYSNDQENMYTLGKNIKELENIEGIDNVIVMVNDKPITRRELERYKVHKKCSDNEALDSLIRDKAMLSEASKLNIDPPIDELNQYLEGVKKALKNNNDARIILGEYLRGRQMTEAEYFKELEYIEYENFMRQALWEFVRPTDKIKKEAEERNVTFSDVSDKYYSQYADNLVDSAQIVYTDDIR